MSVALGRELPADQQLPGEPGCLDKLAGLADAACYLVQGNLHLVRLSRLALCKHSKA